VITKPTSWLVREARTKYLDPQVFSKDGVPDWQDFIAEINKKKLAFRKEAEEKCEEQGHILSPWTCMNSTLFGTL